MWKALDREMNRMVAMKRFKEVRLHAVQQEAPMHDALFVKHLTRPSGCSPPVGALR